MGPALCNQGSDCSPVILCGFSTGTNKLFHQQRIVSNEHMNELSDQYISLKSFPETDWSPFTACRDFFLVQFTRLILFVLASNHIEGMH